MLTAQHMLAHDRGQVITPVTESSEVHKNWRLYLELTITDSGWKYSENFN